MGTDIHSILKLCGLGAVAFIAVGFGMLYVASRNARREFRSKGFLRPPSGAAWIRFLLWKQYTYFENPTTRLYFGITHFCMMGFIVVVTAMVVLVGSEYVLNGMGGFSFNGATISLGR